MTPINLDAFFDDKSLKGLRASMAKWAVPGVSIALTHGNDHRVICLGERDTGLPMTPRTRMPLASNSKLVMVLATAQALKLKGFPLGLKTRVKDVHPAFELKNKVIEAEATFEDVFCHRLRLPANNYHLSRPLEGETVCERLSHVDPLEGYDDNQTSYSNFNYDLAVEIIESLTNRPYEEFVSQAILAPLSMHDSSYSSSSSPDAPMAAGWHKIVTAEGYAPGLFRLDHPLDKMGARVGMGGVRFISTAEDMCSYLKALPTNEAYQNACQPRLTHLSRFGCRFPDSEIKYGLGVQIATSRGVPIIGHTGACSGFRSYVGRFPEQDIGLAVLTNSTNGEEVYALIQLHILGVILGEDLSYLEAILDQERDAAMKRYIYHFAPVKGDPSGEELIGTYTSPAYGDWSFDHASNLPTRPECAAIPWLGAFYGSVRPVVTAIGGGKYEGCIEWKGPVVYSDGEGETVERISYGMPFVAEVKGDELRVYHFHEAGGPRSVNDPVLVFHKK